MRRNDFGWAEESGMKSVCLLICFVVGVAAPAIPQGAKRVEMDRVVSKARELAGQGLRYLWGSKDIAKGGLDCSGFVFRVFKDTHGVSLPPTASTQYRYVQANGTVFPVVWTEEGKRDVTGIRPGDLLFWQNTRPTDRKPPVGHVMIYVGKDKDGRMLMAGAQNSGAYQGKRVTGVNVYDFNPDDLHGGIRDKDGAYLVRGDLLGWGRITRLKDYRGTGDPHPR